eukprot:scaffold5156_cov143-Cylindrotheca_fusiformis.AAC.5
MISGLYFCAATMQQTLVYQSIQSKSINQRFNQPIQQSAPTLDYKINGVVAKQGGVFTYVSSIQSSRLSSPPRLISYNKQRVSDVVVRKAVLIHAGQRG